MQTLSVSSTLAQNYLPDANEFLEEQDSYIRSLARKYIAYRRKTIHPDALDMEMDDLAQQTRIKVWLAWCKQPLTNPRAYINRVSHNESVTMIRRDKPAGTLPVDDDGELYQGEMVLDSSLAQDPSEVVEQEETLKGYIVEVVKAVAAMPRCQQRAMLCLLKERIDDSLTLINACRAHNIDIENIDWPTKKSELQSAKSLISASRKQMRDRLKTL